MESLTSIFPRIDIYTCKCPLNFNSFPERQILDSSKLKEFADNNFRFHENGGKFYKKARKHCGKRRNCSFVWYLSSEQMKKKLVI